MEASATTPSSSTADGVTVEVAARHIASLGSQAEVDAFVEGDDRKGVKDAAEARKAELAAAGNDSAPTATAGINPLSTEPPPEAKPGKPVEESGGGTAVVRVAYPADYFEHGIDGVPVITSAGVEVDRGKIAELLEVAENVGQRLEEVEE